MVGQGLTHLVHQVVHTHLDSAPNCPAHHDPLRQLRLALLGCAVVLFMSGPINMHSEVYFYVMYTYVLLYLSLRLK